MDIVILKKGNEARSGELQQKSFSIDTGTGTHKIPTDEIEQMHFDVSAYGGRDKMLTSHSEYLGEIQEDPIRIKLEDTQAVENIPQSKIRSIILGF